jgi:hypothetical protein
MKPSFQTHSKRRLRIAVATLLGTACAFNAHADFSCRVNVQGVLPHNVFQ